MRLIDADKFREEMVDRQWNLVEEDHESIRMDEIGHWINKLDNEPTEEAIPIEWMEIWAKCRKRIGYDLDELMVRDMLEGWRKQC